MSNIKIERYGSCILMHCSGDIACDTLEDFAGEIDKHLADDPAELLLNMAQVGFVDSTGLEYLLDLQDRLSAVSAKLSLTNLPDNIAKIMEATRLDSHFEIVSDASDILDALT